MLRHNAVQSSENNCLWVFSHGWGVFHHHLQLPQGSGNTGQEETWKECTGSKMGTNDVKWSPLSIRLGLIVTVVVYIRSVIGKSHWQFQQGLWRNTWGPISNWGAICSWWMLLGWSLLSLDVANCWVAYTRVDDPMNIWETRSGLSE